MKNRYKVITALILLIIVFIISLCVGRYNLSVKSIFSIIIGSHDNEMDINIFKNIRLPRTVLVMMSGGALALAGLVYQSIFKNPLVSPDVLGVSSGCSVGAIIAIIFTTHTAISMQSITLLSGIIVVIITMLIAKLMGGNKIMSLLISGIVMSSVASSFIMALKYVADPDRKLPAIEFWLMGGFSSADWSDITTIIPLILIATIILYLIRWKLKVLSLGDDEAQSLGLSVKLVRALAILCATVLVSAVVSVAGVVSWIGLIAPHIIKLFNGDDIKKNFLLSIFSGSILLLISDILSRSLFPVELPISILTSLIGAIFLLIFLWRDRYADRT